MDRLPCGARGVQANSGYRRESYILRPDISPRIIYYYCKDEKHESVFVLRKTHRDATTSELSGCVLERSVMLHVFLEGAGVVTSTMNVS
jgi:hypothetical protein